MPLHRGFSHSAPCQFRITKTEALAHALPNVAQIYVNHHPVIQVFVRQGENLTLRCDSVDDGQDNIQLISDSVKYTRLFVDDRLFIGDASFRVTDIVNRSQVTLTVENSGTLLIHHIILIEPNMPLRPGLSR